MQAFKESLEKAWEVRISRELEASLELCSTLKQQLKLPAGHFDLSILDKRLHNGDADWERLAEVGVLWASLTRALQGMSEGERLINEIETFVWRNANHPIFSLTFEKGLIAFNRGDYALALENFKAANPRAKVSWEKICCAANILFCLENLGLPEDKALTGLETLLAKTPNTPASRLVKNQVDAYRMRQLFRAGHIQESLATSSKKELNQPHYLRFWLRSLPFHNSYQPLSKEELAIFHEQRFFLHKEYRARSLKGILHPDDLATIRPTEFADRLYLWVWKWLLAPQSFSVVKVITALKNIDLRHDAHRLTLEDLCLIRNSFLWLGLFDPLHEKALMERLASIEAHGASFSYPLFALESLFIHYCRALRDGQLTLAQDLLCELENHPLCKSKELYFCPVIKTLQGKKSSLPEHLFPFAQHLSSLVKPHQASSQAAIVVDMALGKIETAGSKKAIYSKPMAAAIELLSAKGSVSLEEFYGVCFGIGNFDALIHMPRVYNLLARLKNLKKLTVSFRVKAGLVIAEGQWNCVELTRENAFSKQLSYQPEWTEFLFSRRPSVEKKSDVATRSPKSISWRGFIKRDDVEKLIDRPRSTTNRLLSQWVEQGIVIREGKARRARYRMQNIAEISLESP